MTLAVSLLVALCPAIDVAKEWESKCSQGETWGGYCVGLGFRGRNTCLPSGESILEELPPHLRAVEGKYFLESCSIGA